jgi:hypothetical protein
MPSVIKRADESCEKSNIID